jgi:hypothetical protein
MATSLSLENDSSLAQGYLKVNGSTAATLTTSGITGNLTGNVTGNVTGNLTGSLTAGGSLTLATAQTATGTAVDFTSIPSWVKRITVIFNGISTNGSSNPIIQIGAGSITSTGYTSHGGFAGTSGYSVSATTGIVLPMGSGPSNTAYGRASIELIGSNTWVGTVVFGMVQVGAYFGTSGGYVSLAGSLDRLRITTVNGTDTFDAGTINISYEG